MLAENKDKEYVSNAINGLSTGIVFLLLIIFGLIIHIIYFTQPIPDEKIWPPDSGGVPSHSISTAKNSVADTTSAK
jgi:hypothetical protein